MKLANLSNVPKIVVLSPKTIFLKNLFKAVTILLLLANLIILILNNNENNAFSNAVNFSVKISEKSDFNQKTAYAIGVAVARNLATEKAKQEELLGKINNKYVIAGLIDGLYNNSQINDQELEKTLADLDQKLTEKEISNLQDLKNKNLHEADNFFAQNRQDPDVIVTDSGIQYKYLHRGNGLSANNAKDVKITYVGKNLKGEIFDQQLKGIDFNLSQVIPGLKEIISLLREDDEVEVWIPAKLAYRDNAVGSLIEPFSALYFKIKLLKVLK